MKPLLSLSILLLLSCTFTENQYQTLRDNQERIISDVDTVKIISMNIKICGATKDTVLYWFFFDAIDTTQLLIDSLRQEIKQNKVLIEALINTIGYLETNARLERALHYTNDSAGFKNLFRNDEQLLNNDSIISALIYKGDRRNDSIFRILDLRRFGANGILITDSCEQAVEILNQIKDSIK